MLKKVTVFGIALCITLVAGIANGQSAQYPANHTLNVVLDDPPGTGNDGEDTTERGIWCRVLGIGCPDRSENLT